MALLKVTRVAAFVLLVAGCRAIIGSLDDCNASSDCFAKGAGLVCVDHLCVRDDVQPGVDGAMSVDASAPHEAGDARDAIAGTLPANGDFESAGPACGPVWETSNSTLERSSDAHGGTSACKVCRLGNPGSLVSTPKGIPTVPQKYRLGVWIRTAPSSVPIAQLNVNFMGMKDGVALQGIPKAFPPTNSYQHIEVDLDMLAETDGLGVQISNPGGDVGSCFLVDDVTMIPRSL